MKKISELLYKRIINNLSQEENDLLEKWADENRFNHDSAKRLSDINHLEKEYRMEQMVDTERAHEDMMRRIAAFNHPRRQRHWLAAASIAIVCLGAGAALMRLYDASQSKTMTTGTIYAEANVDTLSGFKSIKHGEIKAILTSQNGATLTLGENDADKVVASLLKSPISTTRKISDLKLEVPRGGEFKIILEDSTEVWLNSESVLRYPETFSATERRVEIDGEAYFSVKPDKNKPFYVVNGGQQIRVYGTSFNVRGYSDDATICTTLETGKIAISKRHEAGGEVMLSPGHQAIFNKADQKMNLKTVNPQIYSAWRNGKFVFEEQTLAQIMKDLSRWYNFEYEFIYSKASTVVFKGRIPRYDNLETAIQILETSGGIKFILGEDDKILISSTT